MMQRKIYKLLKSSIFDAGEWCGAPVPRFFLVSIPFTATCFGFLSASLCSNFLTTKWDLATSRIRTCSKQPTIDLASIDMVSGVVNGHAHVAWVSSLFNWKFDTRAESGPTSPSTSHCFSLRPRQTVRQCNFLTGECRCARLPLLRCFLLSFV